MALTFIGTLHVGLTPHDELAFLLEEYRPELLLVEIQQEDIDNHNLSSYPDEMQFAYQWAKERNIDVYGFDCDIAVAKTGVTKDQEEDVIQKQKEILAQYTWKEANRSDVIALLESVSNSIIDQDAWDKREELMQANIEKYLKNGKNIVVVTGAGHLDYFASIFTDAVFPLK